MRSYNCIIVDDERPALKLLTAYIEKLSHLKIVATCETAFEALSALQENDTDILFLDIQMPDLTGIELLKSLKRKPHVIMTTAYREYAVEGFEMDVNDYLIKPFSFSRFLQAVNKVTDLIRLKTPGSSKSEQEADQDTTVHSEESDAKKVLFLKGNQKMERVVITDILYIESMREYISVHLKDKRFVIHKTMSSMMEELPISNFIRVHRSHIVNLKEVSSISGNTLKIGEKMIVIGRSYRKAFFNRIPRL